MKIRDNWQEIKRSLRATVEFVNQCGADRDNLTSSTALIPLAYYLFQNPGIDLAATSTRDVANRTAMRKWLIGALLTGAFGSATDSALTDVRSVLSGSASDVFPASRINDALRKAGRATRAEDVLDSIMGFQYGRKATTLALSLLYPDMPWGTVPHHVDHIFSRSLCTLDSLEAAGSRHLYLSRDRIENLCLITESENESKGGQEFINWVSTRDQSYLFRHLIPTDPVLWKLESFGPFLEARRQLMLDKLSEVLGVHVAEGEEMEVVAP